MVAWYIVRMVVACLCGFLIGLERKNRAKAAGIRTHCLVCCAATLMMIISVDMANTSSADPSRIAAQIVSGVGFLGAGMIFIHKNTITGLTSAAGVWATSGVGMAIGAGMYIVGIAATLIIVLVQILFHLNFNWMKTPRSRRLVIKNVAVRDFQNQTIAFLKQHGITVHDVYIEKTGENHSKIYTFIIEIPGSVAEEDIINMIDYECKLSLNS